MIMSIVLAISVASSPAEYCIGDIKGNWVGTMAVRVVTAGVTSQVAELSFQIEDVTAICLMNGGVSPSGVNPATNIPTADGSFTNHFVCNFSGTLTGRLEYDTYGAWTLSPAGVLSFTAYMHEYGTFGVLHLPPKDIDLHFNYTTDARFVNPSRFEAYSTCIVTGTFAAMDFQAEVYYDFVLTRSLVVTGDFDGDGLADSAMVNADGYWYIWFSSGNYQIQGPFDLGLCAGRPVAADFDGDGKTDPAFVDAAGNWHVWRSSANYQHQGPINLGSATGQPVAADFDGDGRADPALADSQGNWHFWLSADNYQQVDVALDSPLGACLAADFDGDDRADPTVYQQGKWYIYFSGDNYHQSGPYLTGNISGMAAARDFDGDGKADPVIVDGSENWHVWISSENYRYVGPFPWIAPRLSTP